jgi:hypothetical protein
MFYLYFFAISLQLSAHSSQLSALCSLLTAISYQLQDKLFYRDALGEISRLINICPKEICDVVCE